MAKLFGLPVLLAVGLGVARPYAALALMPFGFMFLFLLMLWAGLGIEWSRVRKLLARPEELLMGLFFLFVFFPLVQWLLSRALVSDAQFRYGLLFASLTPVAVVAPFFTRLAKGDEELSFLLMVVSTAICPIAVPLLLNTMPEAGIQIDAWPLVRITALLVSLPLAIGYAIARFLPRVREAFAPHLGWLNMVSLSVLVFILFGTAMVRLNLNYASSWDLGMLLLLVLFQDFGVLFISRWIFPRLLSPRSAVALSVSLAMKNIAIAAGVLLFYDPKSSFPAALGFVAHAFLFSYIKPGLRRLPAARLP